MHEIPSFGMIFLFLYSESMKSAMGRTIQDFKSFNEALADEKRTALARTPQDRIMLLHKLIKAWMKFPKLISRNDDFPTVKRIKNNAGQ